ncbi:exportin 7 [Anaeramoeba flamelloides]|uniref:Exportin 7 n=1 Tax=Anaeramoeba flamelloides TaxID=1746091 RepID=A0ABQ8X5B2_9EUKA|nr:exportin 7 [Anaeramoeba flamelloides]
MEELNTLEELSINVYESTSQQIRNKSEETLIEFINSSDSISKILQFLDHTNCAYLQLYLSTQLRKIIIEKFAVFSDKDLDEIKLVALNFLTKKSKGVTNYVQVSFQRLLAIVVKLSWEPESSQQVIGVLTEVFFSDQDPALCLMGLKTYGILVEQFSQQITSAESLLQHRQRTISFRGQILLDIFRLGILSLESIATNYLLDQNETLNQQQNINGIEETLLLGTRALDLLAKCLSFDFLGSPYYLTQTTSDKFILQLPSCWANTIQSKDLLPLFFLLYQNVSKFRVKILQVLFFLSSIRTSIYTDEQLKMEFLSNLISGTLEVLLKYQYQNNNENENLSVLQKYINENQEFDEKDEDYDQSIIHGLARIIYKIKLNYQMKPLTQTEQFLPWIEEIANLTFSCFEMKMLHNAENYFLEFWGKLSASLRYVRNQDVAKTLKRVVHEVLAKWINFVLETISKEDVKTTNTFNTDNNSSSSSSNNYKFEDNFDQESFDLIFGSHSRPLSEESRFMITLEATTELGLCNYSETTKFLSVLFKKAFDSYKKLMSTKAGHPKCGKTAAILSILVTLFGSFVGSKDRKLIHMSDKNSLNEAAECDARLASLVFNLLEWNDSFILQSRHDGYEILETSFLLFLDMFRRAYVSPSPNNRNVIYQRLYELTNIKNHIHLLKIFINKIINNLQIWSNSELILQRTLALFDKLTQPYCAGPQLLSVEKIDNLFINHTEFKFPFLDKYTENRSYRRKFYQIITTLLLLENDQKIIEQNFSVFVKPFEKIGKKILLLVQYSSSSSSSSLSSSSLSSLSSSSLSLSSSTSTTNVKHQKYSKNDLKLILGLIKDLLGVVSATNNHRSYTLLFDWLYPDFFELFNEIILSFSNHSKIIIQILKLLSEISYNRYQRISFESWSPNGVYLVKVLIKIVYDFSSKLLQTIANNDGINFLSQLKDNNNVFKFLKLLLQILVRAMSGNYAPIGAFHVYSDNTLHNAIDSLITVVISLPQSTILNRLDLYETFISLIEILSKELIEYLIERNSKQFILLIQLITQGFAITQNQFICDRCCMTIDSIVEFYFKMSNNQYLRNEKKLRLTQILNNHFENNPNLLKDIFNSVFNIVIFESKSENWAISKLFLSLILIEKDEFLQIKQSQINKLDNEEDKIKLEQIFDNLVDGIENNLDRANKSKFRNNLEKFVNDTKIFDLNEK